MDLHDRWERPRLEALEPSRRDMSQGDSYTLAYVRPDGTRIYVAPTCDVRAVADEERCERLARLAGHAAPDTPAAPEADAIWTREPSPEQVGARNRAYVAFVANLPYWSDAPMPRIAWRWLLEGDDPTLAGAWGFTRWTGPGEVQIALRVDASPARIYKTTLHEAAHANDHELLRYGAPRELLEQRADHIQHVLAEAG